MVVQKTGWGKSLVYFLATKILRKRTKGITLIISPLLALMNNQIVSAKKLGLNVGTINSENTDNWEIIIERMKNNQLDALIISPERLANDDFKRLISTGVLQIALFVVDEAHCISDWGHDFRPDYRRIVDIIRVFPSNIPILATTATANDRVIEDIKKQLGEDIAVSRGSLMRKSLALQIIKLKTKEERLAWIADHIGELPGTGIIYCLTVNDCQLVHKWLCTNGISARCYYADIKGDGTESKEDIVSLFMSDQIKVLVATVAFGMGFDKPNIGFVIHFQKPGNIVAYYQQIGRAGRGIDNALAILLSGEEDNQINNYFIESAFPTENLMEDIVKEIRKNSESGLKQSDLEKVINMNPTKIKACIKYLMVEGAIYKEGLFYYPAARLWKPDMEKSRRITEIRKQELAQINDFTNTIAKEFLCETGKVLSNYGDAGWGRLVIQGKYNDKYFDDQLVDAAAELLVSFVEEHNIQWVTSIPSIRRPALVSGFAVRLAERLHLKYIEALEKVQDTICQKKLHTSFLQHKNVLLIDDMVDSRWTFTVCGYKLRKHGCGKVFPFALANSAGRIGDN